MFTKKELLDTIEEINTSKHSIQNCEKLAAIYTVLDHMYPDEQVDTAPSGYSMQSGYESPLEIQPDTIRRYGDSDFLELIEGRTQEDVCLLMDEVMDTLSVLNPRLYDSIIRRLR